MSYGEHLVRSYLEAVATERFLTNFRPSWLQGLELDFYFPSKRIGIEFQGDHHYVVTSYSKNLKAVQRRDRIKRKLCEANGVRLIRLDACDLWGRRMWNKLKPLGLPKKKDPHLWSQFQKLEKACKEYRQTINAIPGTVSAMSRKQRKNQLKP